MRIMQAINVAALAFAAACGDSKLALVLCCALGGYWLTRVAGANDSDRFDAAATAVGVITGMSGVFVAAMPPSVEHRRIAYCVFACCVWPLLIALPSMIMQQRGGGIPEDDVGLMRDALSYSGDVYGLKNRVDVGESLQTISTSWKFHSENTDTTAGLHSVRAADGMTDMFVYFSGSESKTDWHTNFTASPAHVNWGGGAVGVHAGFLKAFNSVKDEVSTAVFQECAAREDTLHRIVCVGHSLGGALATLCGLWLVHALPPPLARKVHVVTFGAPSVGDAAFVREFDARVPKSVRAVTPQDPVPRTLSLYYAHVKGLVVVPPSLDVRNPHALQEYDSTGSAFAPFAVCLILAVLVFTGALKL